ncbi:hypothetical protein OSB04_026091 [Centaurea solstitialis]|uniref:3'-5' exonuclease domain-containing protein n=1 Tax=Centaurea solstitialis TaxID=347529 RepID=A0AA38W5L3_9ASTR|nr:hypothetical protein OSB04_026091 [Centaurea solstitialis]
MDMDPSDGIHLVSSTESPEFTRLNSALTRSSIVGLDAEWKPVRGHQPNLPTVLLLQIACRLHSPLNGSTIVFLIDLSQIHLPSIYHLLRDLFLSPHILKLGFRFKQDLLYLSSTFSSHEGCHSGFHTVEPFLDIATIYSHLHHKQTTRKTKVTKSLSFICQELLGISLSKELQCSDWSRRPLTEDQRTYAAMDALCLLEIFNVFQLRLLKQGGFQNLTELDSSSLNLGLKQILREPNISTRISRTTFCDAVEMVRATTIEYPQRLHAEQEVILRKLSLDTLPMDYTLLQIVRGYSDKIVLTESDGKPRTSKKKGKRKSSTGFTCKEKRVDDTDEWRGPAPWDCLLGGDGFPKFLCDVMVEGLAKHLRCVGIDAAVPYSRKPETRELIDQAIKEKRVLLTRDAKLLRHEYLLGNQIYRVKSLLKNDQLIEVIETFQLKICEDQLMSRCTKCNGRFIQKPLSIEEAIEAAKGFQVIPNCLFDRNIEFWQCIDCNQLYWEGTQYHNAVQKFIDVCKISSA